ncbi:homeobox protein prospero-like [Limulus polyphemus]|uniref:Homeobox protein prospero-like n=1 Tax=Limulus polyphemus TaxID=6850 RepID=A0ABM1SN22_LIMPO|nr:homeobox protein prospero-like [Limulus polyphemus]
MMSLEEDLESLALHEKPLKTKRPRQRVDAGEPRNSYSSVASFSVRSSPPFQPYQNGSGMPLPSRVYDSLVARQTFDVETAFIVLDSSPKSVNSSTVVSENSPIIRQSKMYLNDNVSSDADMPSIYLPSTECSAEAPLLDSGHLRSRILPERSSSVPPIFGEERVENRPTSRSRMSDQEQKQSPAHSPAVTLSPVCPHVMPDNSSTSGSNLVQVKRARVETIVSSMHQCADGQRFPDNPSQVPVNGCKKRKLYQPQQHEVSRVTNREYENEEKYDKEVAGSPPKQRHLLREDLKSQLQKMQEQLAVIQQHYTELFTEQVNNSSAIKSEKKLELNYNTSHDDKRDRSSVFSTSYPTVSKANSSVANNATRDSKSVVQMIEEATQLEILSLEKNLKKRTQDNRQSCIVKPNDHCSQTEMTTDLDSLVAALKSEISSTLTHIIDSIVTRYKQTKNFSKTMEPELTKDPTFLSQTLDRKSPRAKVLDRSSRATSQLLVGQGDTTRPHVLYLPGIRPPSSLICPTSSSQSIQFASMNIPYHYHLPHPHFTGSLEGKRVTNNDITEQTEAMSLVVTPKKKRHKVTDTRVTPRLMSQFIGQEDSSPKNPFSTNIAQPSMGFPIYTHHPPPLVPVNLPTSVAIPNPSLHHSESFPYHHERTRPAYFSHKNQEDDSLSSSPNVPAHYPGPQNSQAFSYLKQDVEEGSDGGESLNYESSLSSSSTLTPMHLRKAKLMFFYVRYPSSTLLKLCFPDIKFNKNNTAQLVKWFSNFREFFYIQMEKFSRQALNEGLKNSEELKVNFDSELMRTLNLHYNRNNHIEVPENFRFVVEHTLREFFKVIKTGKDQEQSWKKSIYKVIARLDDKVPENFKTPNFLE